MSRRRLVFGTKQSCPQCGTEKPSGGGEGTPADWRCPKEDCINNRRLVFGTKRSYIYLN